MADGDDASKTYVLSVDAVRRAITRLEAHPIHEHFAGYLALLRAKRAGASPVHMSDILEFHDRYLRVVDAPDEAPYVRPFKSRGKGLEQFNRNVAGSYAPSSVRQNGKMGQVIEVTGQRQSAAYDLRPNHATLAFDIFLGHNKVPITSLAAFVYRDYGFVLDEPKMSAVRDLFRDEFGLRETEPAERTVFQTLFQDDASGFTDGDLQHLAMKKDALDE